MSVQQHLEEPQVRKHEQDRSDEQCDAGVQQHSAQMSILSCWAVHRHRLAIVIYKHAPVHAPIIDKPRHPPTTMPTKISYQTWSGGTGAGDSKELVSFCAESPQEVLRHVFGTHDIYKYRGIYRPVDWNFPNNVQGLIIEEMLSTDGLPGLSNTVDASVYRLDLPAKTSNRREKDTYGRALAEAIDDIYVWNGQEHVPYLYLRDTQPNARLEARLAVVKEVVEITLGIEAPTEKDLQEIHRRYLPERMRHSMTAV
jgi:hypothetical protein